MSYIRLLPCGFKYRHSDYLYHVVLSFQDSDTEDIMYIVKYYGKHKQWWHYEVISATMLQDILKRQGL